MDVENQWNFPPIVVLNKMTYLSYNKMDETITAEETMSLEEIKETLPNENLASALDKIKDYFEQQDRMELNIAVTGESGSGKSTFINAFRGMGDEEAGSAETGVVETTKSRIDHSIVDEKRKKTFDEQKTLDAIRENCNQGLKEAGVDSPVVFLISSVYLAVYDFKHLQKTVEDMC
ncbi:hypothetical protein AOLI_G00020870 [Acnodon oligacanthus]